MPPLPPPPSFSPTIRPSAAPLLHPPRSPLFSQRRPCIARAAALCAITGRSDWWGRLRGAVFLSSSSGRARRCRHRCGDLRCSVLSPVFNKDTRPAAHLSASEHVLDPRYILSLTGAASFDRDWMRNS